jgi:hypothetical protein
MADFIDLANAHRHLLQRILNDEDDDFFKIESDHPTTQSVYPDGSTLNSPQTAADAHIASSPVLSKSAEAELYLLATNFLLCESFGGRCNSLKREVTLVC